MQIQINNYAIGDYIPRKFIYDVPIEITVRELIDSLAYQYGERLRNDLLINEEIAPGILVMLNGESLLQPGTGLNVKLHEGDRVTFAVMVFGG